jgi:hypothetical protein
MASRHDTPAVFVMELTKVLDQYHASCLVTIVCGTELIWSLSVHHDKTTVAVACRTQVFILSLCRKQVETVLDSFSDARGVSFNAVGDLIVSDHMQHIVMERL